MSDSSTGPDGAGHLRVMLCWIGNTRSELIRMVRNSDLINGGYKFDVGDDMICGIHTRWV